MDTRKKSTAILPFQVAFHQGPPQISFAGRNWQRGVPQSVTAEEWAAMQARSDCAPFDFRPTQHEAPAIDLSKE